MVQPVSYILDDNTLLKTLQTNFMIIMLVIIATIQNSVHFSIVLLKSGKF